MTALRNIHVLIQRIYKSFAMSCILINVVIKDVQSTGRHSDPFPRHCLTFFWLRMNIRHPLPYITFFLILLSSAASGQDTVTTSHHRQESGIVGQSRISSPSESSLTTVEMTPRNRAVAGKPLNQTGRKGRIPGQKLKQVCEILHCKRAAREMAEQKRLEASDRNCNSAGSSSSGTVTSMEEPILVNCDFQPINLQSEALVRPPDTLGISQAPCAHNNSNQGAVNLRKLLGTRPMTSLPDHGHTTYPKHMDFCDMVLDLSVPKLRDTQQKAPQSRLPMLSQESTALFDRSNDNDSPMGYDSSISMDLGKYDCNLQPS